MVIEALERRVLLSYTLSNKLLTVTGKSTADQITFIVNGTALQLNDNGAIKSFAAGIVTNIIVNAGAGNDQVTLIDAIIIPAALAGGNGNDTLRGGGGKDFLSGGSGNDSLDGGGGADVFDGGIGNDTADYSSKTNDLRIDIDGTADDGEVGEKDNVGVSVETILGGRGNDSIAGSSANNLLTGGPTNSNGDTLLGMGGNDTLQVDGFGNSILDGGDGNDLLQNQFVGNTTLNGGIGNDTLLTGGDADLLSGGPGNDTADYSDFIHQDGVHISLDGVANDGTGENDNVMPDVETIIGSQGPDFIVGSDGNNLLIGDVPGFGFLPDNDTLVGNGGNDTLQGGEGDDLLYGANFSAEADVLIGGQGFDTADYSQDIAPVFVSVGDGANDGITGENDDVQADVEKIVGTSGSDIFAGDGGDNTFDGGLGADYFFGGLGNDTVDYSSRTNSVFASIGDGLADGGESGESDFIAFDIEIINGGGGPDTLLGNDAASNTLRGNGGSDLIGSSASTPLGNGGDDQLEGGEGEDFIYGGGGKDHLDGGNGNDTLYGFAGDDFMLGGAGADQVDGNEGNDTISGGGDDHFFSVDPAMDGNDILIGEDGIDTADYSGHFGANVFLSLNGVADDGAAGEGDFIFSDIENLIGDYGNDVILGDDGPNSLDGGGGVDQIGGYGGNDTINGGFGNDTINGGAGDDLLSGGDPGYASDTNDGADRIVGGPDFDTVDYSSRTDAISASLDGADNDGAANEHDNIALEVEAIVGGSGNDYLVGDDSDNRLEGRGGNDILMGLGGLDTLLGGDQNDLLDGGANADTMQGGSGTDTADYSTRSTGIMVKLDSAPNDGSPGEGDNVFSDIENVIGGSGNDTLTGNSGPNTFDAGLGADLVSGRGGIDTIDYRTRTHSLSVDLDGVADDGESGEGDNIMPDVENILGGKGDDLLTGNSSNDLLRGGGGADVLKGGGGIDTADYSDKTAPVVADIDGVADDGTSGEHDLIATDIENIIGGSGSDRITGNKATNLLSGGDGNDTLDGGPGADTFSGGNGNDTADYSTRTVALKIDLDGNADDGASGENDNVKTDVENVIGGSGNDSITGNAANNILDGGRGGDILSGLGGNDTVDYSKRTAAVSVSFDGIADDGESAEKDNVKSDIENAIGGNGSDNLVGNSAANLLRGNGGNDTLTGGDGNDMLDGGAGADLFSGGNGFDTADYSQRTQNLTIDTDGVSDDGASGEKDNVQGDVEQIVGGRGNDRIVAAGSAGRSLNGGPGKDSLIGGNGNDTVSGGAGNDFLSPGFGNDSVTGGEGADLVDYSGRATSISSGDHYDSIKNLSTFQVTAFGGEVDRIDAQTIETLVGGSGDDNLGASFATDAALVEIRGGPGNDDIGVSVISYAGPVIKELVARGGEGDDHITVTFFDSGSSNVICRYFGDAGNDTFRVDRQDCIHDFNGGTGIDTVDYYLSISQGFTGYYSIDNLPDDGYGHDNIHTDVENVLASVETEAYMVGSSGANFLQGSALYANMIFGGGGNDTLSGEGMLNGGDGNDTLESSNGFGPVTMIGGGGADTFVGDDDPNHLATVSYADSPTGISATFDGGANDGVAGEHDNIGVGIDAVIGTAHADTFAGDDGDQTFYPGLGTDDVHGGGGTDSVDYSDRTVNLSFTGDDVANDGAAGEHDNIHSDVENITGGSGNDTFVGTDADNVFVGGAGADDFVGGGGNDLVDYEPNQNVGDPGLNVSIDDIANDGRPGEGDNVHTDIESVRGGPNADTLSASGAAFSILPSVVPLVAPLETAGVSLIGGGGADVLIGGPEDDYLDGTDPDPFASGVGVTMIGNGGNDVFVNQGASSDVIDGGEGLDEAQEESFDSFTDVEFFYDLQDASPGAPLMASALAAAAPLVAGVQVTDGVVFITGTDGNDSILVSQSVTGLTISINGAAQSVLVAGIRGINIIAGGGNDNVDLMNNPSKPVNLQTTIKGGDGNDTLNGGTNADAILGGRGNDRCIGNAGGDILNGGDKGLTTNDGTDVLIGGADGADGSRDAVDYASRTDDLKLTLDGVANDGAIGENDSIDVENIFSGKGNDLIRGDAKQNVLTGGLGKDTIFGGDNIDKIVANAKGENQQYDTSGKPLPVDSVFGEGGNDFLELRDNTGDAFSGGKGITTRQIDPNSLDISVLA